MGDEFTFQLFEELSQRMTDSIFPRIVRVPGKLLGKSKDILIILENNLDRAYFLGVLYSICNFELPNYMNNANTYELARFSDGVMLGSAITVKELFNLINKQNKSELDRIYTENLIGLSLYSGYKTTGFNLFSIRNRISAEIENFKIWIKHRQNIWRYCRYA